MHGYAFCNSSFKHAEFVSEYANKKNDAGIHYFKALA